MVEHTVTSRLGRNISLSTFDALPDARQHEIAGIISRATSQPDEHGDIPQMLPITEEDIFGKFLGVVASVDGRFGGFIGAMQPDTHRDTDMSEVGSLWVEPGLRRHGIGGVLVQTASNLLKLEEILPYAFCNPQSLHIFARNGYDEATLRDVPEVAGSLCAQCPKRGARLLGVECCDTVMVYQYNNRGGEYA